MTQLIVSILRHIRFTKTLRKLQNFSIYTIVGFLSAGIKFLILPILTNYLTVRDYGILSLINTYVSILVPIVGFGAIGLSKVEYFKMDRQSSAFRQLFSSIYYIPFFNVVWMIFAGIIFGKMLSPLLEIPWQWVAILPIIALISTLKESFNSFLILEKKAKLFGVIGMGSLIGEVLLTLLFVIALLWNWQGRVFAAIIIAILLAGIGTNYFYQKGYLRFSFNFDDAKKGIIYGFPLIFHILGKFVINQSDRIFLAKMTSLEDTGLYSVGYQIGTIILIFTSAFISIYTPFLYERLKAPTYQKKIQIVRLSYAFIIGLGIMLVLLYFATPFIFSLLNKDYAGGSTYVFWIGLSYWFWGIYTVFTGFIFFNKKTSLLGYLSVIIVFINIAGNYLLINYFGSIGAAYSTAFSFAVYAVFVGGYVMRKYSMPWFDFTSILSKNTGKF